MNKQFQGIKTHLNNINFNFEKPEKNGYIDIEIIDKIKIIEINNDIVDFNVIRDLKFKSLVNSYIHVVFESSIKSTEIITKEEFIEAVKKDVSMISGAVFTKISLLIANVTNMSPLGTIITPPVYNMKEIEIE